MSKTSVRRDRTARLLKVQLLLGQYPKGLKIKEIAQKCFTSTKTIYRDLKVLEDELGIPIWEDNCRRGIAEGYFLPSINFTLPEAMNIFLAVRLMQNLSSMYNPSIVSAFLKLDKVVPSPLKKYITDTIEYMEKQPRDGNTNNFDKLVEAWLSQHKVKIRYQTFTGDEPEEYTIEPYFIEPAVQSRSNCVIAYCDLKKSISAFKLDHISNVHVESEKYIIPSDFNVMDYVDSGWDIYAYDELKTVKLRFNKQISKSMMQTRWHPSQITQMQSDGSMIMILKVRNSIYFRAWIMTWGDKVEVLEPEDLRNTINNNARSITNLYSGSL
jgi:predicted DNA-binding transcriptional regulator YafY